MGQTGDERIRKTNWQFLVLGNGSVEKKKQVEKLSCKHAKEAVTTASELEV